MIPWAWRLLPRKATGSVSTSSANQRAEDHHRQLEAYGYFLPIQTRWQDNDQYGHVNNAVYYSYFDTIINHYLLSIAKMPASSLSFLASVLWRHTGTQSQHFFVSNLSLARRITFKGSMPSCRKSIGSWSSQEVAAGQSRMQMKSN
ncbi:uncharacterized protein LOC114620862 isoform X2 [Grammomys surdaster]|uniref:uncharacterized protein LOC114620862 isoform X2 n=1 Tax=Grammomys surdaster TaxID=491861 RepID=UPI00109F7DD8|nr:uncharacterized protein LOC114620862 isoform X2 [Grammomys surdaster]